MKRWVKQYGARTAPELLDILSPTNGLLAERRDIPEIIYRGHGCDTYQLIPAAFRGKRLREPDGRNAGPRSNGNQIRVEIEYVWEFFQIVDARGLRLPEDSQRLRESLKYCHDFYDFIEEIEANTAAWPPDDLLSLLALAQHYGVPTRMLDWSRNPYIAAYFAASDCILQRKTGRLAVWAFDYGGAYSLNLYPWLTERLRLVTASAADIPNLFAQQGLFLLLREGNVRADDRFNAEPYDKIIRRAIEFDLTESIFFRFTLPARQAPELLRLLSAHGIDASTIFPGYDGVVRALHERALLAKTDSTASRSSRARAKYAHVWKRWRS
jgi:hypothetical protein